MNKMKKLLILGGTQISLQILNAAKEMGMIVYVADYNEDSPCKKFADKSFMTSATDVRGIVKIIKDEQVDGVLMGYADVLLPYYNEICKTAKVPCYSNRHAIDVTTDKAVFKRYCQKFNIPTVPEYSVSDIKEGLVEYPVIVKPVDNSGARGIYICNNIDEFNVNYHKALEYSKAGKVIIERMMTGMEATIFYYLHDGAIYLMGVADRWMYTQNQSTLRLPIGYTFPSKELTSYIENQDENVKKMFRSLGMKEGMVFMQSFVEDDKYIIYEMGYRLTGSIEHHVFENQYSFNHLKAMIDFAVGNEVDVSTVQALEPGQCCMGNATLLLKKGTISKIEGVENLTTIPGVVAYHMSYNLGAKIDDTVIGRLAQVGARVLFVNSSQDELLDAMDRAKESIRILDANGEDMIIKDYSYNDLCK